MHLHNHRPWMSDNTTGLVIYMWNKRNHILIKIQTYYHNDVLRLWYFAFALCCFESICEGFKIGFGLKHVFYVPRTVFVHSGWLVLITNISILRHTVIEKWTLSSWCLLPSFWVNVGRWVRSLWLPGSSVTLWSFLYIQTRADIRSSYELEKG